MKRIGIILAVLFASFILFAGRASADGGIQSSLYQSGTVTSTYWIQPLDNWWFHFPGYNPDSTLEWHNYWSSTVPSNTIPVGVIARYTCDGWGTAEDSDCWGYHSMGADLPAAYPTGKFLFAHTGGFGENKCLYISGHEAACDAIYPGLSKTQIEEGDYEQGQQADMSWMYDISGFNSPDGGIEGYLQLDLIWYGAPPEYCPNGWFTDTHFYSNTWQVSPGVSWTMSEYHIPSGGTVSKPIVLTYTGEYMLSVFARSTLGAYMVYGFDADTQIRTIPASGSFAWYTGTYTMTAGSVDVSVGAGAGTTGTLDIDIICMTGVQTLQTDCIVTDPDFVYDNSWTVIGTGPYRATVADGTSSGWVVLSGFVQQQVPASALVGGQSYEVELTGRPRIDSTTYVHVYIDRANIPVAILTFTASSTMQTYTATMIIPELGEGNLRTVAIGTPLADVGTVLDYVCLRPIDPVTGAIGPCGINQATMDQSASFIANGRFEVGTMFWDINITGVGWPIAVSGVIVNTYNADAWASNGILSWAVDGRYQVGLTGVGNRALGIVPKPLSQGINQSLMLPMGDFTVVLRSKPNYINSRLTVNGVNQAFQTVGAWTEYSFQSPHANPGRHNISIVSDCGGGMCAGGGTDLDSVVIDDVYVVPGLFVCGEVITVPITPPSDCINPNPNFEHGATDWHASPGASITYGAADLGPGSYIEQWIPVSPPGSSQGSAIQSLVEGGNYSVYVSARREHPTLEQSFSLIMGGLTRGTNTPASSEIEQFVYSYTVPSGASSQNNGSLLLRVLAGENSSGTVVVHQVCVRRDGSGTPPPIVPPGPGPQATCIYSTSSGLLDGVFWGQEPYEVPSVYSGTFDSDTNAAKLIYNWAVYPLVCTTLSVADWQYHVVRDWNGKWAVFEAVLWSEWLTLFSYLEDILAKLGQRQGDLNWLLELLWMLLKLLFELLLFMLRMVSDLMSLLLTALKDMMTAIKAEDAVAYPFDCTGTEEWVCFGLAGLAYLDQETGGNWFNTLAYIAVAALTIWLVWWLLNQVKSMNAGGDSEV